MALLKSQYSLLVCEQGAAMNEEKESAITLPPSFFLDVSEPFLAAADELAHACILIPTSGRISSVIRLIPPDCFVHC